MFPMPSLNPPSYGSAYVMTAALVFLLSSCTKPTELKYDVQGPLLITNDKGAEIPSVQVLDQRGNALEKHPEIKFSLEPESIGLLEKTRIVPMKNGKGKLIASLEGTEVSPVTIGVEIKVVDEVRIACASPCLLHVGEGIPLSASVLGLGGPMEASVELVPADTAIVQMESGLAKGVSPGKTTVSATVGDKTGSVAIEVLPAVDELRMVCPTPPFLLTTKRGQPPPTAERSCEVGHRGNVRLNVQAYSTGKAVNEQVNEWLSSDNSVRVVSGEVSGESIGGGIVSAKLAGLVVDLPVVVVDGSKKDYPVCREGAPQEKIELLYDLSSVRGAKLQDKANMRCQSAGRACMESTAEELREAASTLELDESGLRFFVESVIAGKMNKCCCQP